MDRPNFHNRHTFPQPLLGATFAWQLVHVSDNVLIHAAAIYICLYSLCLGQYPTMDHRAYKTLHMPLTVPDGFTVEQVGPMLVGPMLRITLRMIPLTMEQYNFATVAATSQPWRYRRSRSPTLGFIGMLYSLMDCMGYFSWMTHEGLDSTLDMTTFYILKVSLQTDELFQKVYQNQVTLCGSPVATHLPAHGLCRTSRRPLAPSSGCRAILQTSTRTTTSRVISHLQHVAHPH